MHERRWLHGLRAGDLSIMRSQFRTELKATYSAAGPVETVPLPLAHNTWAGVDKIQPQKEFNCKWVESRKMEQLKQYEVETHKWSYPCT
jgi:hypothetical protein